MPKNNKKIGFSVVIPNYNGEELLKKNLPAVIEAGKRTKNLIREVIVVDDFSEDASVETVKKEFPEVKLIKHTKNRGFSAAVNTGARTASSAFLVLLNTDVKPSSDFLEPVGEHFKNENVFAVSFHEKGYGWAKGDFKKGFIVHQAGNEDTQTHPSFWASGGSAAFRRNMWMELKGMDGELYAPFYWEDVDLSYRAQKRGWLVLWEPESRVEHDHEATTGKVDKKYVSIIQERNHLLFNWRNITSERLMRRHLRGLFGRIIRQPGYLRIVFLALKKISEIIERRKIEKKQSKVSDEAILARF